MKNVCTSKCRRTAVALIALVVLVSCLSAVVAADTATQWTTNAGHEPLVNVISNTNFEILNTTGMPTELFSYDTATTNVNSSIETSDISFTISIDPGEKDHGDFYGIFVMRISDPSSGIWGPSNSGLSLQFNKGKIILRRWSRGIIDTEKEQSLELDILDGEPHQVNIKVEEYKVTATVDDQTLTAEYAFLPSAGGYQFMAYNSKVTIAEFEDGTTAYVPPATEPSVPTPTNPLPTNPLPTDPTPTQPQNPNPPAGNPTTPGDVDDPSGEPDGNSLYVIIAVVVVAVCVGIGAGYYLLVVRKKK